MNRSRDQTKADSKRPVKVEIPRGLHQSIIKIQAEEDLDFEDACLKAALLLDLNSKEYRQAIEREARRASKSEFMSQLNTGRETIRNQAFADGQRFVREHEDNFRVPCSICGKPMQFSSRDQ